MNLNPELVEQLRADIAAHRTVAVVGAGVAAALSDCDATQSWTNLIRNGIRYVEDNCNPADGFRSYVESDLAMATAMADAALSAASKVENALGGRTSIHFKKWLATSVGVAPVDRPAVGEALLALGTPVATFNYDTLLESISNRSAVSWRETASLQKALAGATTDIAHLHGLWRDPESIVLGGLGYGAIEVNEGLQSLQRAVGATRSMLFVGCGEGLSDPNFGLLRSWLSSTFGVDGLTHYRLCLSGEADRLDRLHADEAIAVVPYGEQHSSLADFLHSIGGRDSLTLQPGDPMAALRFNLVDSVRDDAVLSAHMDDIDSRRLEEILVRPIVLPVTQEQYAEAKRDENLPDIPRSDVEHDLANSSVIVLASPESNGLTSALRWMTSRYSALTPSAYPLVLDYVSLFGGSPLDRSVRKSLRQIGLGIAPDDPIPTLALGIDNVMPSGKAVFGKLVREVANLAAAGAAPIVIGCREGVEPNLVAALRDKGVEPTIRYLGLLNESDIVELAALVEPVEAREVADRAVEIIRREHITRSPLNVSLLISVILQGDGLLSTASGAALLDAYVSLLLGRGDPQDDSRFSFDLEDRVSMLSALAERFVDRDLGQIKEADAVDAIQQFFDEVRWNDSAAAALDHLARRHVLVIRHGQVRFAQSSFLHLFCAKRAKRPEFRDRLLQRPFRYSRILQIYAALSRDDEILLAKMLDLVTDEQLEAAVPRGRSLSRISDAELPSERSIEEALDRFYSEADDRQRKSAEGIGSNSTLDELDEPDIVPFPSEQVEQAPPLFRVILILNLVSVVLRDSEQVLDYELKRKLLSRTLKYWGLMIDCLDADEDFVTFMADMGRDLAVSLGVAEHSRNAFAEAFAQISPVLVAAGGVEVHLTSRKLFRPLLECFDTDDFAADAGSVFIGAFLAWAIREHGWAAAFRKMQESHGAVTAVASFGRSVALSSYREADLSAADANDLVEFLGDQMIMTRESRTLAAQDLKQRRSRIITSLKSKRMSAIASIASSESRARGGDIASSTDDG